MLLENTKYMRMCLSKSITLSLTAHANLGTLGSVPPFVFLSWLEHSVASEAKYFVMRLYPPLELLGFYRDILSVGRAVVIR